MQLVPRKPISPLDRILTGPHNLLRSINLFPTTNGRKKKNPDLFLLRIDKNKTTRHSMSPRTDVLSDFINPSGPCHSLLVVHGKRVEAPFFSQSVLQDTLLSGIIPHFLPFFLPVFLLLSFRAFFFFRVGSIDVCSSIKPFLEVFKRLKGNCLFLLISRPTSRPCLFSLITDGIYIYLPLSCVCSGGLTPPSPLSFMMGPLML